jgi:TatD DNase family protein
MIIDSHCHLDYEPLNTNIDTILSRAKAEGVEFMLTISTEDKKFNSILSIIKKYKEVYGTYGIHPHEAKNHLNINTDFILKKLKIDNKIIGIGETGLDFFYNHSDKNQQVKLFEEHILASQESNLPLIIHTRSAEEETYEILKKANNQKKLKMLIHCFTGSRNFATKLLELGAYISASGVVTFKKSQELAETFKYIPQNRILVETDSPYLSPVPFRGKSNEPSFIIHTLKFLSDLKRIDYKDLSAITSNNFFKLFGKLK